MASKTLVELCALLGLRLVIDILQPNGGNIPNAKLTGGVFEDVSEHDTANKDRGANARMHHTFVKNGGGASGVSFTFAVDDKEAIQILALDNVNYAQGTAKGNRTAISIERCVNADANQAKAIDNTAKLTAALLVKHSKPLSAVKQHNFYTGKNCPASLRNVPGAWDAFIIKVAGYQVELERLLLPPDISPLITVPQFQDYYLAEPKALTYFGLPLEASKQEVLSDGNTYTVQYFERARFELHGTKVLLGLIGAELRKEQTE